MENYVFDGSLDGLLTLVFDFYNRKPNSIKVWSERDFMPTMFDETHDVITDEEKANRVKIKLKEKLSKQGWRNLYCTFLSEQPEAFQHIFEFVRYVIDSPIEVETNFGNEHVLYLAQMQRKVNREKHHFEAFIRFEELPDGTFYSTVEPKYNILPLILNHFKNRYADQDWIIYDLVRKTGLLYSKIEEQVVPIHLEFAPKQNNSILKSFEPTEEQYQHLWKGYFKSANIPARKNTKLHVQLLPKRFWKYLTEKEF
ncbi:MAG: TIGR03915 family putative DNA repair protein [Flavobacteriaceae bacterium]|nr:TIGR03915 family putative DNA repair protein [Candidatus Onthonaster equi]